MKKRIIYAIIILSLVYLPLTAVLPASTGLTQEVSAASSRPVKYYMADRVVNNSDFATLSGWGINTAVVEFEVNASASEWRSVFTEAGKYGINIVVWPSDWNNPRPNCGWGAPYPVSTNGDISKVKGLIDVASEYSNFIGIVNAHEPFWSCTMSFDEMAGLKDQLKAYALSKGRDIKVWNYVDNLFDKGTLPDDQIARIMDVAVTWTHCAGNVEGTCDTAGDSNSALANMISDRQRITDAGLEGVVELVFAMQTFTMSGYNTMFNLNQLESYSCEFINSGVLDGFAYYTWDAGWWTDLHNWTNLQPAVPYVYQNCVVGSTSPTSTSVPPTNTSVPTSTNTPVPTSIPTTVPTNVPTTVPTSTTAPTKTSIPTSAPTSLPTTSPTKTATTAPTTTTTVVPTSTVTSAPTNIPTTAPSLGKVSMEAPLNASSTTSLKPIFDWSNFSGATSYTIQVSRYANFSTLSVSSTTTLSNFQTSTNFARRTYYWRVKANNSDWSEVWTITIK